MTASALVGVSGPPVDDEVQAAAIWTALAGSLVVPGRRYQVKQVSTGRKYSRRPVRRPLNLPSRPTAALLFDGDGLAHWLGCDLDVGAASSEEVLAAGRLVESVLFSAGFGPFMDMSPRGGVHVWARLNAPEAKAVVLAVLRGIQSLVASRFPQVKLDLAPMSNLKEGCLSLPGSPCVGGGWRRLADGLDRAVAAVQHRPGPEALNRLADLLDVQFGRWDVVDNMLVDDGDQPVLPGPAKPLPTHTLAYLRDGEIAPHAGQSEARRSALLTMIWHRWTLAMTQQEIDAGNFTGLASDISRPGKGGHRYLAQEWCRARTAVLTALRSSLQEQPQRDHSPIFRQLPHIHGGLHGGAVEGGGVGPGWTWVHRWLCAADQWVREGYSGEHHRLTVATVLHGAAWLALIQDDGGDDRGLEKRVAELPVRSLSLACGLMDYGMIASVLRELREIEGSPLGLLTSGAGTARGSRYYLRQVAMVDGVPMPTRAPRIDPVGPLWSVLGSAAWRVHKALQEAPEGLSAADVTVRTGLRKSAVYDALKTLKAHDLARADGRLSFLGTACVDRLACDLGAIARYTEVLAQIRAERQAWKDLLASSSMPSTYDAQIERETGSPAGAAPAAAREAIDEDVEQEIPVDLLDARARAVLGPVPWDALTAADPGDDPWERTGVEDQVLDLLADLLGACLAEPEVTTVRSPVFVRTQARWKQRSSHEKPGCRLQREQRR